MLQHALFLELQSLLQPVILDMDYLVFNALNALILFSKLEMSNGQIKRQLDAQLLNQLLLLLVLMDIL